MPTRLLLVDGDPAVQRMVELVAQSLELDASCFKDAITALDAIGRLKPALVIADYRMTGATFIAFCERIAGMELASPPPIVTLAAAEDQFDEAELRFLGVKAFVRKPPQPDTLHDTIRQLCTDLGLTPATPKISGQALPPGSADLADLVAREVGRQLPLFLQAELPGQIARAYPREDMTLIAMEAVQQALPDISHQLLADLKPMIQERVKEVTERLMRELIDKRVAERSSDCRDRGV
ncbi:MAG: response regulator [Nitrospirota bacterium]|nr:response regulator [Nitrospirota bacterium]MDE3243921.1 response regulator [Nitrospirota bacterium]